VEFGEVQEPVPYLQRLVAAVAVGYVDVVESEARLRRKRQFTVMDNPFAYHDPSYTRTRFQSPRL